MNKVQFFSNDDVIALQESINLWLQEHTAIEVLHSDMNTIVKPDLLSNIAGTEKHIFYILYTDTRVKKRRHALNIQETIPAAGISNMPTIDMPPPSGQASVANQVKDQ